MASKIFFIVLLLCFCKSLPAETINLVILPHERTIEHGSTSFFQLSTGAAVPEEVVITFHVDYPDIIEVNPKSITVPEGQSPAWNISLRSLNYGIAKVITRTAPANVLNDNDGFINVKVHHSSTLDLISFIVGWMYFVAWSVSFYPQIIENWRRKSVVGLNFDFIYLNFIGFTLYSVFNCAMYWISSIQTEYELRHPQSANPVMLNDVGFSLHAMMATVMTIFQCLIYERGGQRISLVARGILGVFLLIVVGSALAAAFHVFWWLDFIYICSYVKLAITLIKYLPQAYMNYKRKSTIGWSIGNILLDFMGGTLSMLQMLINAYNFNDWESIFGDPTKFGLGLFSVVFDIFFIFQHFVLYRNRTDSYEELEGGNYHGEEATEAPNEESHPVES